jgi:hypothetical protein
VVTRVTIPDIETGMAPATRPGPERSRVMSAQTPYLEVDAIGVFPTVLFLLVMLLTALGIVAHVAFA